MRISDAQMKSLVLQATSKGKKALFEAGEPLMTGQKVNRPSDDPLAAQAIAKLDENLAKFEAYDSARIRVDMDLSTADSTLITAQDVLAQIKELTIQMANETYSAADRTAAAEAVSGLKDQLLALANTQQADGRYLFAGVAEGQPAYDANGVYQGSEKNREVEILPGLFVNATLIGSQTFGGAGSPTVFEQVQNIVDALQANDPAAVQAGLADIDTAIGTIGVAQATIGGQLNNLTQAEDTSFSLKYNLIVQKAQKQDPDFTTQVTEYQTAEQALTTSIELSKKMLSSSLMNWLR